MNAVAKIEPTGPSVLVSMADRYGMQPAAFEATVRATVCKGHVSREEFAAFLLVAKEHRLNPLTKEIYAFPAKGGGIQPIVSIDGWARIINEHPQCDGVEFTDVRDGAELLAVECRIYRKDRSRPTCVTEYMAECRRSTDVWKQWPARMLRHKALIQCARYAFGFSGIVDPDEYERSFDPPPRNPVTRRLHAGFDDPAEIGSATAQSGPEAADAEFSDVAPAGETAATAAPAQSDEAPGSAGDDGGAAGSTDAPPPQEQSSDTRRPARTSLTLAERIKNAAAAIANTETQAALDDLTATANFKALRRDAEDKDPEGALLDLNYAVDQQEAKFAAEAEARG